MNPDEDFSLMGILCKFLITFVFGLFVAGLMFLIAIVLVSEAVDIFWDDLVAGFWAISFTSGIMGVFYFEKILGLLEGVSNSTLSEMGRDAE